MPIILCLLTLGVLSSSEAIDVQNVTITGMIESHYALSGVVTVKFQDVWGYVCYYGSKKRWGKREATTACKQLGYTGGWPTMRNETRSSTHYLYNFDCDEYLDDLNYCEFDTTLICERSKIAGIQCYNFFETKLLGGSTPNLGRVQVKYDNVTSDVCYTQEDSSQWGFYNTQVLCTELGYPGAMLNTETTEDVLIENSQIGGYQCKSDLRESSLQECNPDLPRSSDNEKCSGVTVSCTAPGYVGCFNNQELTSEPKITNMTINECRHYCREKVYRYAFLSRGDTCACSTDVTGNTVGDKLCNSRCFGDSDQTCGGLSTVSVYDVTEGICNDPQEGKKTYFFGEIFTPQCEQETQVPNQNSIQCVLSKQTGKLVWNSTEAPKCSDDSDNNKDDLGLTKTTLIFIGVLISGCCVLIAVLSLYIYRAFDQRQRENNGKSTHQPKDGCTEELKNDTEAASSNNQQRPIKSNNQANTSEGDIVLDSMVSLKVSGVTGGVKELFKEFKGDVSDLLPRNPLKREKIMPIENHFGPAKGNQDKNQPHQDHTYRNKRFYNRKKKHKSEYNRVPDIDPEILCKHNDNKDESGTDIDAVKSKAGGDKGDPKKSNQNTSGKDDTKYVSAAMDAQVYAH